jgi:hypothetical protein
MKKNYKKNLFITSSAQNAEFKFISEKHTKKTLMTKKNCSIPFKIYLNHCNLFGKIKCVVGDEMEIIQRENGCSIW